MFFTLILENSSGDRIDMTTTANQYMTSKISGLHPPPGTVSTSSYGTSVVIGTGKAWIDGHYFINDTPYTLDLSKYVDESLSRYVTIGISCDVSENIRACKLEVKSGTAATTPAIPVFEDTASKKFLTLAAVFLKDGAKTIADSNIRDMREDGKKCGYVKCVFGKCCVSEILMALSVYRSTVADLTEQVQDLSSQVASLTTRLDDFTADVTAVGSIGDSAYYIMYSNGRLAIRGTGATYDYEIDNSPFFENTEITSLDLPEWYSGFKQLYPQSQAVLQC